LPAEYYYKILYPLQDKVFPIFNDSPFYLTGGTALSRGYYNHRFSDDLDYFVNWYKDFQEISDVQVGHLNSMFHDLKVVLKDKNFYRLLVGNNKLKIEMVNDVPSHIGKLITDPFLGVIDSKENILANKLTAIVDRCLPKDIVDIYFLLKDGLSLKRGLTDADSKAAGIAPLLIAKIFYEFDYSVVDNEIKWIKPISSSDISKYLKDISLAIVNGQL